MPFEAVHLAGAVELLRECWDRERVASRLLPSEPLGGWHRVRERLDSSLELPGVAAFRGARMVGYLRTSGRFRWKEQLAAVSREYDHAAGGDDRGMTWRLMYASLAGQWVAGGAHLHLVCHFAHDPELHDAVFDLGFGAIIAENLRDLTPVSRPAAVAVAEEPDASAVAALAREHARYYRSSPIFLPKEDDDLAVADGDAVIVCRVGGEPAGYFTVGPCRGTGEGLLLAATATAQVTAAYVRPDARERGVGSALLEACVGWARERGYERLFVEHETANIAGTAFWRRHFSPYLFASMRYVDPAVTF